MTEKIDTDQANEARRRFLKTCGKFAVVTPPVVSLMLSSSDKAFATVKSGYTAPS